MLFPSIVVNLISSVNLLKVLRMFSVVILLLLFSYRYITLLIKSSHMEAMEAVKSCTY
jgi:hypothetical protein